MSKLAKRVIGIILSIIGILMFLSLYVIIILFKEDFIKHIITVIGYLCVAVFTVGIILFKNTLTPKEKK